jgi:hypothetical protein
MKRFYSVLILALLTATVTGLGDMSLFVGQPAPLATATAVAQSAPIPVSLPAVAVITLKNGGERSGKVVGFDSQNRTILLKRGGDSSSIPLNQVAKVVYDRTAPFYREHGLLVMRGENAASPGDPDSWSNVPLSNFKVNDASRGQAVVMLDSVLPSSQLRGVRAVAGSSTYVLDEMQFNLQQRTMTVSVIPY